MIGIIQALLVRVIGNDGTVRALPRCENIVDFGIAIGRYSTKIVEGATYVLGHVIHFACSKTNSRIIND